MDEDELYTMARGFLDTGDSLAHGVEPESEWDKEAKAIVADLRKIYEAGVRAGRERG